MWNWCYGGGEAPSSPTSGFVSTRIFFQNPTNIRPISHKLLAHFVVFFIISQLFLLLLSSLASTVSENKGLKSIIKNPNSKAIIIIKIIVIFIIVIIIIVIIAILILIIIINGKFAKIPLKVKGYGLSPTFAFVIFCGLARPSKFSHMHAWSKPQNPKCMKAFFLLFQMVDSCGREVCVVGKRVIDRSEKLCILEPFSSTT